MDTHFLGFGGAVYLIILVIGTPIFFFWRWIFKKLNHKGGRRVMIWLLTAFTSLIFYLILVGLIIYISDYYPNRDFDKHLWQTSKTTRYEYSYNLIESKKLLGDNRNEVLQLLGNDADKSQADELRYNIGHKPGSVGPAPSYLIIDFRDDKAETVFERDP
jgi:hypothetical protein